MTVKVNLPDFSNIVELATERATDIAVANVNEKAVETSPKDTGNYARNIISDFNSKEVVAKANYSAAIEYGFPSKIVKATNAKALRFVKDGKAVFAKSVNLPARQPNPVLRMAARDVQKRIKGIFKREFDKLK